MSRSDIYLNDQVYIKNKKITWLISLKLPIYKTKKKTLLKVTLFFIKELNAIRYIQDLDINIINIIHCTRYTSPGKVYNVYYIIVYYIIL